MKDFARLFNNLDLTNKTNDKLLALEEFFKSASSQDQLVALALFSGRKPKRQVSGRKLALWICELLQLPEWLFEESYQNVGDLAETIHLLIPEPTNLSNESLFFWFSYIQELNDLDEDTKRMRVISAWSSLEKSQSFIFNKMITGGFRVGVNQQLIVKALSNLYKIDTAELTHRLTGKWTPFTTSFENLILSAAEKTNISKPYPFCLAYPITLPELEALNPTDWQVEWKWDGIRGQLIFREGEIFLWSRGEDLVTDKFPELKTVSSTNIQGFVMDGEILGYINEQPMPFQHLQTRIGRKNVSAKMLQEVPVVFMAYDLMELNEQDIRNEPLSKRRKLLEETVRKINHPKLILSPLVPFENLPQLNALHLNSRDVKAEGFMLKLLSSNFEVGRKKGIWYKWKVSPLTIDGVLIYAQKGHGRRAGLYTDYTFAVWKGDALVPFAKAYSGLTNEEIKKVDDFIKKNTIEKFGPVRTVNPQLVFEIGFEGIQSSPRHKSGIALRFPRILRWRKDKTVSEANTIEDLKELLGVYGQ